MIKRVLWIYPKTVIYKWIRGNIYVVTAETECRLLTGDKFPALLSVGGETQCSEVTLASHPGETISDNWVTCHCANPGAANQFGICLICLSTRRWSSCFSTSICEQCISLKSVKPLSGTWTCRSSNWSLHQINNKTIVPRSTYYFTDWVSVLEIMSN